MVKDNRFLFNQKDREQLKVDLADEDFARRTCSFYRYIHIDDPQALRDELYKEWFDLRILGRVYIATEPRKESMRRSAFQNHAGINSWKRSIRELS